jgi:hypothetical protein
MEIFQLWRENNEFRNVAIEFHKRVLQDLLLLSDMMLNAAKGRE